MSLFGGSQPIILPKLGGLYTFLKPVDVPSGYSPNLQNVRFLPRAVLTRPGITQRLNSSLLLSSAAQFINNSSVKQTILLDQQGNLYRVDATNTPQTLNNGIRIANPTALLKVQQSFGREFMSFYYGFGSQIGTSFPLLTEPLACAGPIRHWDGNFDLPINTNFNISGTAIYIQVFHLGVFSTSVTVTSAVPTGVAVGQNVIMSGWAPAFLNGTFTVATVTNPTTFSFTIHDGIGHGSGTATTNGVIINSAFLPVASETATLGNFTAGVHFISVIFEMAYGTLSKPVVTVSWTASGGHDANMTNIPIGPAGCVARRLVISTVSDPTTFYYLPGNRVGDNVTQVILLASASDVNLPIQGYPLVYTGNPLSNGNSVGPTLPPLAPDGPGGFSTIDIAPSPSGVVQFGGGTVIFTTIEPHGLSAGQTVTTKGMANAGYNATFTVQSVINPFSFYSSPTFSTLLPPDGGGTVDAAGSMTAQDDTVNLGSIAIGVRQVQVVWETRWGYLTAPGPTIKWTAAGGFKAIIGNIPIGPWYVTARRLLFTLSGGADFFYITKNRIPDNTTTQIDVDFDDVTLAAGSNFDYLARNYSPMDSYGVGVYGGRLVTWGGLNTLKGGNFGFDGGWNPVDGTPLGWTPQPSYVGGEKESIDNFCGECWRITGDGVTPITGQIGNASIQQLMQPNTSYTVSFRAGLFAGNGSATEFITVDLFSTSLGGVVLSSFQIPTSALPVDNFFEFQGDLNDGFGTVPPDVILRVYASGTLDAGAEILFDHLRVWPTNQKYEASVVRFSNPFDPETFDGVDGLIQISKDDGQQVAACVQLRSFFYIYKERSLHTTYDDGTNPPSLWFTRVVDSTIGAGSPNGVTSSDTYLINMWRSGAYMYSGGRPVKLSQEIQSTWLDFSWQYAWTSFVLLDTQNKLVFFFCPNLAQNILPGQFPIAPNNAMVLDYSEGIGQEDDPAGRKWGADLYPVGITYAFKFETGTNEQAIYFVADFLCEHTGTDDLGEAIDSFYETAYVKAGDHGQDTFLGCTYFAEGAGQIFVSMRGIDDVVIDQLTKVIDLVANPGQQYEMAGNLGSERAKIRFESEIDNTGFTVKGAVIYAIPNMYEERPQ